MGDLEDLAAAAHTTPVPRRRTAGRKSRQGPALVIALVVIVAVLSLGGMAYYGSSRTDPGFVIRQGSSSPMADGVNWVWWEVVNEEKAPLVVNSITLNDEFSVVRGEWVFNRAEPSQTISFPATLSIGERVYGVQYRFGSRFANYTKTVIFVEVKTNRGTFRFDGSGFLQR